MGDFDRLPFVFANISKDGYDVSYLVEIQAFYNWVLS